MSLTYIHSAEMRRKVYIETYGCQMNISDTERICTILAEAGYEICDNPSDADAVLINTCAVREHAEQRVRGRLDTFGAVKRHRPGVVIGVLGCMAEFHERAFLERHGMVDIVCGPDEYRSLPCMMESAFEGRRCACTGLSIGETYDDIQPMHSGGVRAWVTVMRGCDNFCAYCVVPFTRGRERSRPLKSVVGEVERLATMGIREVTLLGQNVNSYRDGTHDFADLLRAVASIDRRLRVRFMTSHPKDFSDRVIAAIASVPNICNAVHLPLQSGSDRILLAMNRGYTSAEYRDRVSAAREAVPDLALTTDIMVGFPTETEDDHRRTVELMEEIVFDAAFTFRYSPRPKTRAWGMTDDVPDDVKTRRLEEVINLQRSHSARCNRAHIGRELEVLVEGPSKRSPADWVGRTETDKMVVFPHGDVARGDYVKVKILAATSATLRGVVVRNVTHPASVQESAVV
ncbi:MAG: tRNA (N6-isopentenyl adenosine(37)-C2)-methylthiotransferase MiaB [Bacteroidota bacterium]|nr:tRNA (N6-isopentenyl adenosine(37)-C2)-methylthiotransferase MiaB [Bacteroidota bacterium]